MSFPFYQQLEAMDCGPTCLKIIARFYGKNFSVQKIREKCYITNTGVSLMGISDGAESLGFRTLGVRITWEQLRDEANLPCIAYWNNKHFVVIYKIKKKGDKYYVYISDPASGLLKYEEKNFLKYWLQNVVKANEVCEVKGIVLLLEPTPKFYQEEEDKGRKLNFLFLLQYLRPYKGYLLQILLAMFTASMLSLLFPFITQSVVDVGIGNSNLNFVVMLLIAQIVLMIGETANSFVRSWLMLHVTSRVSISLISGFLFKLMQLPISFFDTKMTGDIMQRMGDYSRIQSFLTGSLLSMTIAAISFLVYGVIMTGYSVLILGIFIVGSFLYIIWVLLFMRRRKKLDYMRFQESAANQNSVIQLISGMQDIKLNNCEKSKRWEWERIQAKLFKISVKSLALGQNQEIGAICIDQTKNMLISFIAVSAVIKGDMTLGMMVAMQYIIGQLNAPISQFISFMQATQDAVISLERLNEIHDKENEEIEDGEYIRKIPADADIEFNQVIFQYEGPHSAKVLNNISLKIPSGKITAVVGSSGSGKTTLLKLMLGFYQPVEGEVLLGGITLSRYSPMSWRKEVGVVMQEGTVFSNTIAENISISDEKPDMERVREAAKIANIDDWIEKLPLGYNTKVGADGHGLSTGQKQRLLIARAAYKPTKYLFFDEATNSLDANNERTIMENLQKLFKGKTVVVVAHRLSTVKDADNIVVLRNGQIVEEGNHTKLTGQKGYYYELVKNQLELGN